MLPFVFLDESKMFNIKAWGLMCAIGYFAWDHVATKRIARLHYNPATFNSFAAWTFTNVAFWAHALDSIFYHPDVLRERWWSIFLIWENMSSMGGIVGSIIGAVIWKFVQVNKQGYKIWPSLRKERLPILPYTDVMCATFPVAMAFGRLGCAIVHDHPGALAPPGTWAAIRWPLSSEDGVQHVWGPLHVQVGGAMTRYDLGLIECVFVALLALAVALTWSRQLRVGTYTIVICLAYTPARFAMDFYRATEDSSGDKRWGTLTFAQYATMAMFAFGLFVWWRMKRDPRFGAEVTRLRPA